MDNVTQFLYVVNGITGILVTHRDKLDMGKLRFDANKKHYKNLARIEDEVEIGLKEKNLSFDRKVQLEKMLEELKGKRSPKNYDTIQVNGELEY